MYDVIVVGARSAGASTALLLGRRGHRVLLVDRDTVAGDVPQAHLLHRHGPRRLARWGLMPRLLAADTPPIVAAVEDLGDGPLVGADLMVNGVAMAYGPRRTVLDAVLVDAAVGTGVEFRPSFTVEEFVLDGDRVTGIRGRRDGGASVVEHATLTVGADGADSAMARAVGAPEYDHAPASTGWYLSHWSGVRHPGLTTIVRDRRAVVAFPTNDELTAVFVGWPAEEFASVRTDLEASFWSAVECAPELAAALRAGRRDEAWLGTAEPSFSRRPHGLGWALVGDAGCRKDPTLALGACDALRDAEFLAEAVDAGLFGFLPMSQALEGFERRRDDANRRDLEEPSRAARLEPPTREQARLRATLRERPDEANRYFMAASEMIAADRFESETLSRLLSASAHAE